MLWTLGPALLPVRTTAMSGDGNETGRPSRAQLRYWKRSSIDRPFRFRMRIRA